MKTYEGERYPSGARVVIRQRIDDREHRDYQLPPRFDLRRHSPDGFEWGYCGSGPAQLALALCADVLNDDARAQRVYQRVKEILVAGLECDAWTLTEERVLAAVGLAEEDAA